MSWRSRRNRKQMINSLKRKTQEYDLPTQLQFFSTMGGCRQISYVVPEVMQNLILNIDKTIAQIADKVTLDEFNKGSFLDEYIDNISALAKNDIINQSIEHSNVIESIKEIEKGYLLDYRLEQNMLEKHISEDMLNCFKEEIGDDKKDSSKHNEDAAQDAKEETQSRL